MKTYILCSSGWDHGSWQVWGTTMDESKAKRWVELVKLQDDRWNSCNFDKTIQSDVKKELVKLGIIDSDTMRYDDSHAGNPFYKTKWDISELI